MGDMSESLGIAGPGRRWLSREDHVGQDRPVDLMDSASTLPTTPPAQPHRAKAQKINKGVTHLPGPKCHLSIRSYSEGPLGVRARLTIGGEPLPLTRNPRTGARIPTSPRKRGEVAGRVAILSHARMREHQAERLRLPSMTC